MALAGNCAAFTPSVAAAQLRYAGSKLPQWWADKEDVIWSNSSEIPDCNLKPDPWGWNKALLMQFTRMGISPVNMPSIEQIEHLRVTSGRMNAVKFNRLSDPHGIHNNPKAITCGSEAIDMLTVLGGDAVIKLPWSSSGRGVFYSGNQSNIIKIIDSGIRKYGYITIEKKLDKIIDFAAIYKVHNGVVAFDGYSLFNNVNSTIYNGNTVAPQNVIHDLICMSGVDPKETVTGSIRHLEQVISPILPWYNGCIGVDMMVYRNTDGKPAIAPCIEINIRRTMGYLALRLWERLAVSGHLKSIPANYWNGTGIDLSAVDGAKWKFILEPETF